MREYELVSRYFEGQSGQRSGMPYTKHIDDGLLVLRRMRCASVVSRSFCLHALMQSDLNLLANKETLADLSRLGGDHGEAVMLAFEYRNIANSYTSWDRLRERKGIKLSPITRVNDMLIADKVQNYSDAISHVFPNDEERLTAYFESWLDALGVGNSAFEGHRKAILERYEREGK